MLSSVTPTERRPGGPFDPAQADLRGIRGTCELVRADELPEDARRVPSYEALVV